MESWLKLEELLGIPHKLKVLYLIVYPRPLGIHQRHLGEKGVDPMANRTKTDLQGGGHLQNN
jgi:hypothetical protein